jgi:hypothetical protein
MVAPSADVVASRTSSDADRLRLHREHTRALDMTMNLPRERSSRCVVNVRNRLDRGLIPRREYRQFPFLLVV